MKTSFNSRPNLIIIHNIKLFLFSYAAGSPPSISLENFYIVFGAECFLHSIYFQIFCSN